MNSPRRIPGLIAIALGTLFMSTVLASPAEATYPDRTAALTAYESIAADQTVDPGWTGSVAACNVGTESAGSLAATLHTVNVLRTLAGLESVTFDSAKNRDALAAALMVRALNGIDHDPDQSSPCYSKAGAVASGQSNLYMGLSGAEAIVGYVEDPGVSSLSHRRWLLDPAAMEFGSGSTGTTNALSVTGSHKSGSRLNGLADDELVAWPSPGWFPSPLVFKDWSAAIGTGSATDASSARVGVTMDGVAVPVTGQRKLESGSGAGVTLGWQVSLPASADSRDHIIKVSITGVKIKGELQTVGYTVNTFDPAEPGTGSGAPPDLTDPVVPAGTGGGGVSAQCRIRTAGFTEAKKSLRKASRSHRKALIRKAKKNVEITKRARKLACG